LEKKRKKEEREKDHLDDRLFPWAMHSAKRNIRKGYRAIEGFGGLGWDGYMEHKLEIKDVQVDIRGIRRFFVTAR